MSKNNLGRLIKEAREKKKLSQAELGDMLHVTRQAVSKWENDVTIPDDDTSKSLCKILGLDEALFECCRLEKVEDVVAIDDLIRKQTEKIKRKIKIIVSVMILCVLVLFCFTMFLIYNGNKFVVYKVSLDSDFFQINNGILIKSKVKNYFQLGEITSKGYDINKIKKVKIYYKDETGERLIIEKSSVDDIVIVEDYGYGEYFDDLFENKDIYLDISIFNDGQFHNYTFLLKLDKIMESGSYLFFKKKAIVKEENNDSELSLKKPEIQEEMLLSNGYTLNEDGSYTKIVGDKIYDYDASMNVLVYSDKKDKENTLIMYYFLTGEISVQQYNYRTNKEIINFDYIASEDKLFCYSDNCNKYREFLDIIISEYEKLI